MERTDVVEAQLMTSGQLEAVRDKIVVDKLTLKKAVLSLFPNFNVDDAANMQELETNLRNTYPEIADALRVVSLNKRMKLRNQKLKRLQNKYGLPPEVLQVNIDWKKMPTAATFSKNIKGKAQEIVGFMLETERLRRIKNKKEKNL